MRRLTAIFTLSAVSLALASRPAGSAGAPPLVRVGLVRHRTSVVVSAPGGFVLTAGGAETSGVGEMWMFYLPSAAPAQANPDGQPHTGEAYVVGRDGVGKWRPLPVRVRPADETTERLLAGPEPKLLRHYEGELEVGLDSARMLCLVNVVDLEAYARGVVCGEMSHTYPTEALKAQAITARSAALASPERHRSEGFNFCAEPHCQAYLGLDGQHPETNAAVAATCGQVLTYNGRPASAVYHAICGGYTENASDAWGGDDVPYLHGAPDCDGGASAPAGGYRNDDDRLRAYLTKAPAVNCRAPDYADLTRFRWVRVLSRAQIEKSLADIVDVGEVVDLRPLARGVSGRITRLEVVGKRAKTVLSPELVIRQALGGLLSSAFVVDRYCDDSGKAVVFVLWGAGWGHGVGMCQVGAAGMAAAGCDYRKILAKYYPGTEIQVMY